MNNLRRQLPAALLLSFTFTTFATTHYVDMNSTNAMPPYTSWTTAANVIQDAVDAAATGDEIIVTNGIYATGGRAMYGTMTNRVAITKPLTLMSVNGPEFTIIQGYQVPGTIRGDGAIRCVYLTNAAVLVGFTLTNGATRTSGDQSAEQSGAGIWCEPGATVSNCVIAGNVASSHSRGVYQGILNDCTIADNSANIGGGACFSTLVNCALTANSATLGGGNCGGTLSNCTLSNNSASNQGGGTDGGILNYCTLLGNWGYYGGGAYNATLNNCSLKGNRANRSGGGVQRGTLNNCTLSGNSANGGGAAYDATLNNCTVVGNSGNMAAGGVYYGNYRNCIIYFNTNGNHMSAALKWCCATPLPSSGIGNITNAPLFLDQVAENFRLQSNSPCINSGWNAYSAGEADLGGHPRIVGGTVDLGAYEFQSPASTLSYAWLQRFGLPTDGSLDFLDPDFDSHNNWQEWRADTVPTNAFSRLSLAIPTNTSNGLALTWQSLATRTYFLERGTNLSDIPAFLTLASDILGQPGTTTFTDTTATNGGPFFYRVGVE